MSSTYIPKALREFVSKRDRYRCSYCLSWEEISGMLMEVDHIIPVSLNGQTEENNLCLACSQCNDYKGERVVGLDLISGEIVALFNPRQQNWNEHFVWIEQGEQIEGITPTGRVTVTVLKLNRLILLKARKHWIKAGWHPPKD